MLNSNSYDKWEKNLKSYLVVKKITKHINNSFKVRNKKKDFISLTFKFVEYSVDQRW